MRKKHYFAVFIFVLLCVLAGTMAAAAEAAPKTETTREVWAGIGISGASLSSSDTALATSSAFTSWKVPALELGGSWFFRKEFDIRVRIRALPVHVDTAVGTSINSDSFHNSYYETGVAYSPAGFAFSIGKSLRVHPELGLGIQAETTSILRAQNSNSALLSSVTLVSPQLSIGARLAATRFWRSEILFGYRYPVVRSGFESLSKPLFLDTSVSLYRRLNQAWDVGVLWDGTIDRMDYDLNDAGFSSQGSQRIFLQELAVLGRFHF